MLCYVIIYNLGFGDYCPNYPTNSNCLFIFGDNNLSITYNTQNIYNVSFTIDYTLDGDYLEFEMTRIYYNCNDSNTFGYEISSNNNNAWGNVRYINAGFQLRYVCDNNPDITILIQHKASEFINFDNVCVDDTGVSTNIITQGPTMDTVSPTEIPTRQPIVQVIDPNITCYDYFNANGLDNIPGNGDGPFCPNENEKCLIIFGNGSVSGFYNMLNKYTILFEIDYELDYEYTSTDKTEIFYNCNGTDILGYTVSNSSGNAVLNVPYLNAGFLLPPICENNGNIIITIKQTGSGVFFNFDEMCLTAGVPTPTLSQSPSKSTETPSNSPTNAPTDVTASQNQSSMSFVIILFLYMIYI